MSENIDNERGQTFTAQKPMTTPTPALTPEQIAEADRRAKLVAHCQHAEEGNLARCYLALAAQLAETRGQLRYQRILTEQIQTSHDLAATTVAEVTADRNEWKQQHENLVGVRQTDIENLAAKIEKLEAWLGKCAIDLGIARHKLGKAEAAAASAREMALEAARRLETMAILAEGNVSGGVLPRDAVIAVVNQYLKSTPPAPVTPLTESEVMPDTSGSRSNSGDNATPQASTLAPGADAPESDLRALAREIPLTRMNEVGARDILEKALEKAYRLGLTRSPGTKEQEHE